MHALILLALLSQTPIEHDFLIHDFHFASGETLPELRIHYLTIGTQRSGNAVLILHSTGGSSKQFLNDHFSDVLFKSGGLLDASHFFIIIPDSIGHGQSSKPSDGLRAKFPHYEYADMIELQHRLVVEELGIKHLYLVLGASMGAMHTWMWGERWPDMMDALVPLAGLPTQISGRNRVWRKMIIDDLHNNDLNAALHILLLAGSSPLQWQKAAPTRDDADRWLAERMKALAATTDANDLLYAIEASRNYDPLPQLERITAPLLAINSADDFVNPPELGIMDELIKRVKHGHYVLLPISDLTRGHGTHTWAPVWQSHLARFLAGIPTPP